MGCESRVYLSKSNLADKEYLHKVRVHLMELGYEVVEWNQESGESYEEHPMLECEHMVMVGYDLNEDDLMEVGKGQYNQLLFREGNGLMNNHYFVELLDFDNPIFYTCESTQVLDSQSWKSGYGQLQLIEEIALDNAPCTKKERPKPVQEPVELTDGALEDYNTCYIHLACITLLK